MSYGTSRPWTNWKAVLLRMYDRGVMIFEKRREQPRFVCDCDIIYYRSFQALRHRHLIERTCSRGGKITWSLTDKGRRLAKEILR